MKRIWGLTVILCGVVLIWWGFLSLQVWMSVSGMLMVMMGTMIVAGEAD